MEEEKKKEKGLKMHTIVFMGTVALFFDALNGLLNAAVLYWAVTIFAYLTFFVWFLMHGILFWKPKRFLTMGGSLVLEFIPIISILPAITAAVLVVAFDAKLKKVLPKSPAKKVVPFKQSGRPSTPRLKKAA